MRFVEQSAELWRQEDSYEGMLRHIERCGRVAYKSEMSDNIEDTKKFVENLQKNGHDSVLEHGTVYMETYLHNLQDLNTDTFYNRFKDSYSKISYILIGEPERRNRVLITTNYRVHRVYWGDHDLSEPFAKRYTMHLITSIGIVRELLRHRKFSFTNESTRFCSYGKNRFGNELTFVQPYWLNENTPPAVRLHYLTILSDIEEFYIGATNGKLKTTVLKSSNNEEERIHEFTPLQAQQVRGILPLDIKSEIVMTGFEDDWKHFFDLRLYGKTGKPHPDMVILAQKIKDEFERNGINF